MVSTTTVKIAEKYILKRIERGLKNIDTAIISKIKNPQKNMLDAVIYEENTI